MRFFSIVASVLASGGYYNGGGASDINALNSSKSTRQAILTSEGTPSFWIKRHRQQPQYSE